MDPTIESLKREVAVLREKLNDTEKKLEIKEAQLRTFVRNSTPFTPKKMETVLEKRPETPKSMKRERESTTFGAREGKRFEGGGIPFDLVGLRGKRTVVGLKVNGVLWEVGVEGLLAALEEEGYVICDGARWLVDEEEVVRRKGLGKTSSTRVMFLRGASEAAGLLRRGLWLGGRWHSVRRFEAVQPERKKTGWVWLREWMEKEGKDRVDGSRRDRERKEEISGHLRGLRMRAEKVEDGEKKKKFEGFGGMGTGSFGSFGGFKEEQKVKPIKGLVLRKDRKDGGMVAEADAFFESGGSGAFGDKAGPPIASGSTVSPEAKKFGADRASQMEFGYRP